MRKIAVSQVDTFFVNGLYPIEFLLYYPKRIDADAIRNGLKELAKPFWPLFGNYKNGWIESADYREADCLSEETLNTEFDTSAPHASIFTQFSGANPAVLPRLFFLKIIHLRNGSLLVPKMNHLAGDGYSYFFFLTCLARFTHHRHQPLKRLTDRILFRPRHRRTAVSRFMFTAQPPVSPSPPVLHGMEIMRLPRREIRQQIKEIQSQTGQAVSTNDLLCALILQKLVVKQTGSPPEFRLTIPIDVRRMVRVYGSRFFGNALQFQVVKFTTADLSDESTTDIARTIRKAMPQITLSSYRQYLADIERIIAEQKYDRLRPFDPESGCLVTNLARLPVQQLDFGGGQPVLAVPLTVEQNSAAILSDADNYLLRLAY